MRREVPLLLTIVFGCFMVIQFFVPLSWVQQAGQEMQQWTVIVAAAAVVLGVANLVRIHLRRFSRKNPDPYSLALLAGLLIMIFLGVSPAGLWTGMGFPNGGIAEGSPFDFLYQNAYVPMQSTMFALLAFFIASAAYRSFRIRRLEAGLLAAAALLVMIGRVPIGRVISDGLGLPQVQDVAFLPWVSSWIMDVPNNAAKRAILIGAALGAISTGLKIILGIERSAVGSD